MYGEEIFVATKVWSRHNVLVATSIRLRDKHMIIATMSPVIAVRHRPHSAGWVCPSYRVQWQRTMTHPKAHCVWHWHKTLTKNISHVLNTYSSNNSKAYFSNNKAITTAASTTGTTTNDDDYSGSTSKTTAIIKKTQSWNKNQNNN